jgi:hypothetical protein
MKFGAWVNDVLRAAASDEGAAPKSTTNELMSRIAEMECKLDRSVDVLKEQSSNIQHDVRVLQLLVPRTADR